MPAQLGKRYRCQTCGTEILCTKQEGNIPTCCGQEMPEQKPRLLPSSD